jgi:hypothetical protein
MKYGHLPSKEAEAEPWDGKDCVLISLDLILSNIKVKNLYYVGV